MSVKHQLVRIRSRTGTRRMWIVAVELARHVLLARIAVYLLIVLAAHVAADHAWIFRLMRSIAEIAKLLATQMRSVLMVHAAATAATPYVVKNVYPIQLAVQSTKKRALHAAKLAAQAPYPV